MTHRAPGRTRPDIDRARIDELRFSRTTISTHPDGRTSTHPPPAKLLLLYTANANATPVPVVFAVAPDSGRYYMHSTASR